MKKRADAMGTMIRAGVDPQDAARIANLPGVTFTGGRPVTLRYKDEE